MGLGLNLSFAAALLLSFTGTALADVVELKNGQRVEGALKGVATGVVIVEIGGQELSFKQDQVRAIYFGAAPTITAAVALPPSPLLEALRALRALQSVTGAGITFREYGPRVNDAKIVVDRSVAAAPESPARQTVSDAMSYYVLASTAWSARLAQSIDRWREIGQSRLIDACSATAAVKDAAGRYAQRTRIEPAVWIGAEISNNGLPALWSCASDKIAEAEKLVKP